MAIMILYVEWIDSKSGGDWEYREDIEFKPAKCRTVGILLKETKRSVTVCHTVSGKQVCGRITIPKACITYRRTLKLRKGKK